jgi:hypothetical protein
MALLPAVGSAGADADEGDGEGEDHEAEGQPADEDALGGLFGAVAVVRVGHGLVSIGAPRFRVLPCTADLL